MESDAERSPMRWWLVAAATILLAAPVLAASFAARDTGGLAVSAWAVALAAVWTAGGGVILRGRRATLPTRDSSTQRPWAALTLLTGGGLAVASLVGGLVLASWPVTAPLVAGPLEAASSQPVLILFTFALVAGAAEEVFFRLALPTLLVGRWRWIVPTVLYALVTLFSGTIALAVMAVILGLVAMWVLQRTERWFTPIMVHALWTVAMVLVFPLVVR